MATDPPYLVDYDGGNHPNTEANGGKWGNPNKEKALGPLHRSRRGGRPLLRLHLSGP